jgi:hypothetical protein
MHGYFQKIAAQQAFSVALGIPRATDGRRIPLSIEKLSKNS